MNRHQRRARAARARKHGTGYLGRLLAYQTSLLAGKPGVHHVTIAHDDGCSMFRGGPCTCSPDMHSHAHGSDVVEVIELDGSVTRTRAS
ncbi:hypothetical protein [Microvirga sp. VF16]|uniref:hypothetical protein n=1 Tax=Microvirga sp. VF16 TaxID=2807101 RepID=UPI00193EBD2C|nr:hypothetical protein [Microvirga sp. VF16]QRM28684.1 hypothetical protein JO965_21025 [Microvirga sp. VF16]